MRTAAYDGTYEGWRDAARGLIASETPPNEVDWIESGGSQQSLFGAETIET